jgi:hypothetical protein
VVVNYLAYQHAERHKLLTTFLPEWQKFETPEIMRKIALAVAVL